MSICGPGILAGEGACEPSTLTTAIWYLDVDNNLVTGERVSTRTCNPDLSTVTYLNAAGGVITSPTVVRVDYTVVAGQGELAALAASPYPTTLTPGAAAYSGVVVAFAPANLAYFSLSLVAIATGAEFSVDAGVTWLAAGTGTITWGNNERAPLNTTNLRFQSTVAGAAFQLIWES